MLFKKTKKIKEPEPIKEPKPLETEIPSIAEIIVEPKIEPVENENDKADFVTTDPKLVFSLQDKFVVKSIFYDKKSGLKTYVFNASNKEIETFLKEG